MRTFEVGENVVAPTMIPESGKRLCQSATILRRHTGIFDGDCYLVQFRDGSQDVIMVEHILPLAVETYVFKGIDAASSGK